MDSSLLDGLDCDAKVLADVFHLFVAKDSNWRKQFGSNFGKIEDCLKQMIHSYTEENYIQYFNAAKTILAGNVQALDYLAKIDENKCTFSRYLVRMVRGNLERQGSTPAEQNHSSFVARIGPRSVQNISLGIQAMFERQRQLETEMNAKIERYAFECRGKLAKMLRDPSHQHKMENSYIYRAQFEALGKLSPWGYEKFEAFSNRSRLFVCSVLESAHSIEKIGSRGPPRIIPFGERCICTENLALDNFQCTHEIARDRGFRIDLFNPFWLQLSGIEHSHCTSVNPSGSSGESQLPPNNLPEHGNGNSTNGQEDQEPLNTNGHEAVDNNTSDVDSDTSLQGLVHMADNDDVDSLDEELPPPAFPPKRKNQHKSNYAVMTSLANEIIEAVSFDEEKTNHVAGVFSFLLDAINGCSLEDLTKEDSLRRYMSQFVTEKANDENKFSGPSLPVPRTVSRPGSRNIGRLKSSAEIRSTSKRPFNAPLILITTIH